MRTEGLAPGAGALSLRLSEAAANDLHPRPMETGTAIGFFVLEKDDTWSCVRSLTSYVHSPNTWGNNGDHSHGTKRPSGPPETLTLRQ